MVTLEQKRQIIQDLMKDYASIPYSQSSIQSQTVFDTERDHYLLITQGFEDRRVHGCLIHLDIIDGKIWIQRDGTDINVAEQLLAAGISKDEIVLGFKSPKIRPHTGYAVA